MKKIKKIKIKYKIILIKIKKWMIRINNCNCSIKIYKNKFNNLKIIIFNFYNKKN